MGAEPSSPEHVWEDDFRSKRMRRSLIFSGILMLASPVLADTAPLPTPGYWISDNKVLSPISSNKTEKRCLSQKDVDRFVSGLQTSHYTCTYPELHVADGTIHLRGECVDKSGLRAKITGEGAYTATDFNLAVKGSFKFIGLNIPFRASTESHRQGDVCPADAKRD